MEHRGRCRCEADVERNDDAVKDMGQRIEQGTRIVTKKKRDSRKRVVVPRFLGDDRKRNKRMAQAVRKKNKE